MKKMLNEYKEFINKGNVVMVAVGLVMALYFKTIVDAIIVGVIMPIISAIFGKSSFEDIGFDIGDARISIGLVLQAIIVFVVVAFILILFLIIKAYNRYVVKPDEEATAATELSLLTEIRDELRSR
jgi:large conductance mechanosensitive channel